MTKSLVSTLGHVCGLLATKMVADVNETARRDSLAGLENRRAWDESLSAAIRSGDEIVISMIDLDGLKKVKRRTRVSGWRRHAQEVWPLISAWRFRIAVAHTVLEAMNTRRCSREGPRASSSGFSRHSLLHRTWQNLATASRTPRTIAAIPRRLRKP